jgi:poly(hydroxyalkanoate) depolymerase family esterase
MKPLISTILEKSLRHVVSPLGSTKAGVARLHEIIGFGSNPGALRAWAHVPLGLVAGAPLVVVLHGCTQSAAGYDTGAGWSQLADEMGFVALFPEQTRSNNPNLCFNWFSPIDSRRDSGEALSIRQMIAWLVEAHDIDQQRVFVTGLSAGGAMTSIMLATYPEVFAGGAVVAGLPYGAVASVSDALSRMAGQGYPAEAQLASLVSDASSHKGPWPRVAVWHGSADTTVRASNADRIIAQWLPLHDIEPQAFEQEKSGGHTRRTWRNDAGQAVLELNTIAGMGHGTPLQTVGTDGCGKAGPYMLEVGTSSTREIAQFWGLGEMAEARVGNVEVGRVAVIAPVKEVASPRLAEASFRRTPASQDNGVQAVIEAALRAAGLMK